MSIKYHCLGCQREGKYPSVPAAIKAFKVHAREACEQNGEKCMLLNYDGTVYQRALTIRNRWVDRSAMLAANGGPVQPPLVKQPEPPVNPVIRERPPEPEVQLCYCPKCGENLEMYRHALKAARRIRKVRGD